MDLDDLEHNTRDGLHIASLAGSWIAVVMGFGGLRDHGGELSFAPRLPQHMTHLTFRLGWRGRTLQVSVQDGRASYELVDGDALEVSHHGDRITVEPGQPLELDVPPIQSRPEPTQPPGRAPRRRRER